MLTTYVTNLIPKLVEDATSLIMRDNFVFRQDGAPAHTAHATQDWLHATAMTLLRIINGHQTRQT